VADFYKKNALTIRVGFSEGGGYDSAARLLARHIGKHIPGNPKVIVENHPGAASVLNFNQLYNQAPSDGSVIGISHRQVSFSELLEEKGVQFKVRDFKWIGGLGEATYTIVVRSEVAKKFEDAREKTIIMGALGAGDSTFQTPQILNQLLGTKFKIVPGYDGVSEITLAMERGEAEGVTYGTNGLLSTHRRWLDDKFANVLVQIGRNKDPRLPDAPLIYDLLTTDEQRTMMDLFTVPTALGYPFAAPPKTPDNIVAALRKAFVDTLADAEFQADAKKVDLEINPSPTGDQLQKTLDELFSTPPDVVSKFKTFMQAKK
jgi:tripartite-type tricarboxylate transporter receptor subunit TctC